ncbi:MAG: FAD-dependent oxidoreductase [Candidatus Omnitrophota bacterium]|jgi:ferredoxin-NADP reductase|nr:MAG: FAD-dependent oxidoreductase [Candidatus Omnitrophota bacterium]
MVLLKGRLIQRIQRTPSVVSFRVKPDTGIEFIPGQFLRVVFDESNIENKDMNKYLSFSSSPLRPYIEFTKRITDSAFSKKLFGLKINDQINFSGPFGQCVLKEDYKKIAFLTGGIGITPVVSMIDYICEKKMSIDTVLFYSNRTEDEIAFKPELDSFQNKNHNIKIFYTITDCFPKDNKCLYGFINKNMIYQKLTDFRERKIFVFGPGGMVTAMKNLCLEMGCDSRNLKTETFIGY